MLKQFYKDLEQSESGVQKLSKSFCDQVGVTIFAYARIYDDKRASWITSSSDQDHFLLDSEMIHSEPTFNTKEHVREGAHLWFCDHTFPGSETFYAERKKRFSMDHGMILARHQKGYLENCYFSGDLTKKPLYNIFANEQPLFLAFMDYFISQLNKKLLGVLAEPLPFSAFIQEDAAQEEAYDRNRLLALCGHGLLATLSQREQECLILFSQGYTHEAIGKKIFLSTRTVEHYLESVKNKLGKTSRPELYKAAKLLARFSC